MRNSLFVIVLLFGCTLGLKHRRFIIDGSIFRNECTSCKCSHVCSLFESEEHTGLCGGMWDGIDCTAIVCGSYRCYNGGKCVVTGDNKPSCHCQQGFHGDHCRIKDTVSPCDSNPCQNEGICLNFGTSFTCSCKYGWSGTTCQNSINLCDSNPCQNGGTCLNLGVSFSCACADGWAGVSCEKDALPKCHDICAIEAVARSHSVFHNSSEKCSNSNTASNEAMVMVCCGLDRQHTWLRGVQIVWWR
ncbi:hypothetical protein ACF0H5_017842 [Mactra antiquata]